jgi:hypothetical protein
MGPRVRLKIKYGAVAPGCFYPTLRRARILYGWAFSYSFPLASVKFERFPHTLGSLSPFVITEYAVLENVAYPPPPLFLYIKGEAQNLAAIATSPFRG